MTTLTLKNALQVLRDLIAEAQYWQIIDETHPNCGGVSHQSVGLASPRATGAFVVGCAYLFLGDGEIDRYLFDRAILATDFLLRVQRPSGLIDLLSVNYDSSPDTAFAVQQLCTVIELGRASAQSNGRWARLLEKLEQFIRRAVSGVREGGFHTPNHRWAIVSALVQARALFPDLQVGPTVEAYLAEEIDIDAEGFFIERSIGVYDAVNDRSLLLIAENWDFPGAVEAVERNLTLDLHLLHADGTAETGLSHRQDFGTRNVPLGLVSCYLLCNRASPNPLFVRAAQMLWDQERKAGARARHILSICHALLKCGDPEPTSAALPEDFAQHFPRNGLWRVRRGLLSASFFQGTTRLLTLIFGQAELSSLKISQTYFGQNTGRFISDSLEVQDHEAILRSEGLSNPRRPGYELPLGRSVPPERWHEMLPERSLRRLPPAASTLTVQEVDGGFDLRYRTLEGLDRVAAQVALDFPPGGIWETEDTSTRPEAGQVLFLKRGYGEMRYGPDVIRIGPGAHAHSMWRMRDAETAPDHVRVLLTFLTPVDHAFHLRAHRGLHAPGADQSAQPI
jgi:hypothetical protein